MGENPRIAVLTGAGISAESGLRTFRDGDGLWEEHRVEDVATPGAFQRDPELVLRFYNERRAQVREAQPNAAHRALAELEQRAQVEIITQNIDDLHERAGSTRVLHLHGEILKARSVRDERQLFELGERDIALGDLAPDGGQLRPHVVWFGEAVPALEQAVPRVAQADLVFVVGTSLQVYPANSLVQFARPEARLVVVDPHAPAVDHPRLTVVREAASTGLPKAIAAALD
ncbi:MAG: NAD-dependent protein deacylase [Planctomycetes bacterium]|nr:NAD-dependent protein deacylase [Planctomycetota bacterium]